MSARPNGVQNTSEPKMDRGIYINLFKERKPLIGDFQTTVQCDIISATALRHHTTKVDTWHLGMNTPNATE